MSDSARFAAVTERLARVFDGDAPTRAELVAWLSWPEASREAAWLRATADALTRRRFGGRAMLLAQVGVETFPCPADCGFCVFGERHSSFPRTRLDDEVLRALARRLAGEEGVYALFLMYMHEYEFSRLLRTVEAVAAELAGRVRLVVNMGDFDAGRARELKAAGVGGAYHVLRLREGVDTRLDPEGRRATVRAIRDAGLDWYYCCEPVGPEHTPEELADQILLGRDYGCFQHAAMRRVAVPGSPLAARGQISELRLAQVVAAAALAMQGNGNLRSVAVHEPNALGLVSGANSVYAEYGANPRDDAEHTEEGRGRDVAGCRALFHEAGFDEFLAAFPR